MRRRHGLLALVAIVATVLSTATVDAAVPPDPEVPPAAFDKAGLSSEQQAIAEGLVTKANATGEPVRVIVGLRVDSALAPSSANGLAPDTDATYRSQIAAAQDRVLSALPASGTEPLRRYGSVPSVALSVDASALEMLRVLPGIRTITEDFATPADLAQSVPLIQGTDAHAAGYTGTGWSVAVLDTGVDRNHSFLAGKVVAEACFSGNNNCPNGNSSQTGTGAAAPCTYASGCRHGTHVSGIAAGSGPTSTGVAPGASIIAVQVFSRFTGAACAKAGEDPCTLTYDSDQIAGLDWVYSIRNTRNIASVNMSLGGGKFTATCDASNPDKKDSIDNLRAAGIATVIATGNDGFVDGIGSPACISTAVRVGSTDKFDHVSSFSNVSNLVSVFAPGTGITSSVPGGGFASFNGTSMATPHVAGAWALMRQRFPADSVTTTLNRLQTTGLPVTDTRAGGTITAPRIRVADAMNLVLNAPSNDNFTSATTLSLAGGSPQVGSNVNATKQAGEPAHAGNAGGKSVWWTFTAPSAGSLILSTQGSSFDTLLGVYTGGSVGALSSVAASDDFALPERWSRVTIAATNGTAYRIAVDGFNGASGSVALGFTWTPTGTPLPPNDNFASATSFTTASSSPLTGSNAGATFEANEPNHADFVGGKSVWWSFTAPSTGTLTLSTQGSSFDTLLGVYTGAAVDTLTPIVSNDDFQIPDRWSRVSVAATTATTYRIAVDGYAGVSGSITLGFTWVPGGPVNDNFASASPILLAGGTPTGGSSMGATKQAGEPDHAGNEGGKSVWWTYTASGAGTLLLTTEGSDFDTLLAVYTGAAVGSLTPVGSNDDAASGSALWSATSVPTSAGTTYRIAVDGYSGASGSIVLNWQWVAGVGDRFAPVTPTRLVDSRFGTGGFSTPWGGGQSRNVTVTGLPGAPVGATAVAANVTVTGPTQGSHLTVSPAGSATPVASNLNYLPGQTVPNLVVVKVGTNGQIAVYNNAGNVDVIIDIVGYFTG